MNEAQLKGHLINAMRMSGFSLDMIKKVLDNFDQSLSTVSEDEKATFEI